MSAVRLHLLSSILVDASKDSLNVLNHYKNDFNQIIVDCLKIVDEFSIDEDLYYKDIQSKVCLMWSDFYVLCYEEMDELGKQLTLKSKSDFQIESLQNFLFPKLDMLYTNCIKELNMGDALVESRNVNSSIALGLILSFFQFFGFLKM